VKLKDRVWSAVGWSVMIVIPAKIADPIAMPLAQPGEYD